MSLDMHEPAGADMNIVDCATFDGGADLSASRAPTIRANAARVAPRMTPIGSHSFLMSFTSRKLTGGVALAARFLKKVDRPERALWEGPGSSPLGRARIEPSGKSKVVGDRRKLG